ncbi:hypothetical protein [Siccirubricoccus phaeus]|uniref:hypothetical protein n=1 Tax=Siccirubricoccus phaeus TaxID=2595053 RepID=UPI0011F11489|nr:hypothetical protein [Siccirubricoccus phaeus]
MPPDEEIRRAMAEGRTPGGRSFEDCKTVLLRAREVGFAAAVRERRKPRPMTDAERMDAIERDLRNGDSRFAGALLRLYGPTLDVSGSGDMVARMRAARARLAEILAHEADHGRCSLLDRSAPEVAAMERHFAAAGLPTPYPPPQAGGGVP